MRISIVLCSALWCVSGLTDACTIINKRDVRIGVERGIEGNCANNGQRVACTLSQDEGGISCEGPGGSFNGANLRMLVFTACGCTNQQLEQQRLEQQLEDYP